MWRAFRYAFDEATTSLWRGRQSGLLSTLVIAVALFVLGGFLLATSNLDRLGEEWSRAAEMSVYLADDASPSERVAIERLIMPGEVVAGFEFVSKAEALKRFKQTFADLAGTAESLEKNPLPESYEVRLHSTAQARAGIDRLAQLLRATSSVEDVRYDRQWLDRLLAAVSIVRTVGYLFGAVLTITAALTVANVVRLALHARRDELEIMQLVGAPPIYIRGPFVMEGLLQGGIGALAALAGLALVFLAMRTRYLLPLAAAANLSTIRFLSPNLCALLITGGIVVGSLGGAVAARGRT